MAYPEWVEKQKRPGTNISCIHGKYYLYEATSVWDPEKKRTRKKTGKYLGRITEAWAFINHISLMLVYAVYARLKSAELLSKYSVSDFLIHLKYVHAVKMNSSWVAGEISGKTQKLLDALRIHIT